MSRGESRRDWSDQLSEYWGNGFTIQEYCELKELPFENTKRWIRIFEKERNGESEKSSKATPEVPEPPQLEMTEVSASHSGYGQNFPLPETIRWTISVGTSASGELCTTTRENVFITFTFPNAPYRLWNLGIMRCFSQSSGKPLTRRAYLLQTAGQRYEFRPVLLNTDQPFRS